MKILLIGTSGKLGFEIYKILKKDKKNDIVHNGIRRKKFNLSYKNNLSKLLTNKINLVINCTALTDVNYCEENKKKCYDVNCKIVKNIFEIKKEKKLNFWSILFSTDQIYNSKIKSKETEKLKLLNYYSKSKSIMEKFGSNNSTLIFRTNFFGKNKKNKLSFSSWIYLSYLQKKKISLAKDVIFNPLHITTISKIIKKIVKDKIFFDGIYNLGASTSISKAQFAIYLMKKLKIKNFQYSLKKMNQIVNVKRPLNMSMNINKFVRKFKISLPSIKEEINKEIKFIKNENWKKIN